jgi:hypothetical protein
MSTFRGISASETRTLQQVAYAFSMTKVQQRLDSQRCDCFGNSFEIVQGASTDNIKLIVYSGVVDYPGDFTFFFFVNRNWIW